METIGGYSLRSLAILFLCGFLVVSSVDAGSCSLGCLGSTAPILKFANGEVYKYQLEGNTISHLSGAKGNVLKLDFSATAEISALPQCSYSLKLSKVTVTSAEDKKYENLKELETYPIHFSYQGGQVGSKVCTEEGDSHVSVNIKRAIISLFQVSTFKESGYASDIETDVFGVCPTSFSYKSEGSKVTVNKVRNLNSCGHRETLDFTFLSTPYYSRSDFQSTPILTASYKSEQHIEDGLLKSAFSHETYLYRPLTSADSGAEISVNTKLTFVSKAAGAAAPLVSSKSGSIIFQAPLPADGISNSEAIIKALKEVVSSVEPTVSSTAARSFGSFVSVLRHARKADILATYGQVKSGAGFPNKEVVKQVFLDGLFRAGSSEAVEAGAELLKSKEISESYANLWYLSFSFTKHASPAALKSVTSLLDNKEIPRQAYLGIGALANRHVREYGLEKPADLNALLLKLAEPLKSGGKVDTIEKENNIIASLKGLRNVQYLSAEVATFVSNIAADQTVRSRIRSVAIDTLKSDPCQSTAKDTVTKILRNINEDAELRIKAYLALVQCPCSKSAEALKEIIDKEEIKQVGSFIISHLRNLRASANPDKFEQKAKFGGIIPGRKFPINPSKYSYSTELSYLLDSLNVGVAGDSNVIYSQHSFLPRSYSLNLTTYVFGQAFNLFEIDLRNENLDHLLEKYFGPKGHFNKKDSNSVVDEGVSNADGIINKIKERYLKTIRPKRSITQADLDALAKKVDLGVDANYNGLDLDIALKVFGTEISWVDYHNDKSSISSGKLVDQLFDAIDASIDKAKNYELDYKKHITFLDNELSYPTGLGLPLKIKAIGSSAVSVKVDGKFDIPALIKDPQNANFRFQFIPSAAVEVSALLTIDAYAVESGLKLATTVHSATGVDVTAKVLDGNGVDIKLGLPVKKQDLVNIKSEVYTTVAVRGQPEVNVPVKFNVKRQEYGGCFDQLSPIVGLTFCGIVEFPWDGFKVLNPIFGPTKVNLRIEKEDDTLTSYNFKVYYNKKQPNLRSLEVILDTPNSQTNRKLFFLMQTVTEPRKELTITLDTPFKKVSFNGFVVDNEKETSLTAKLLNDDSEYFLRIGANISGSPNSKRYEPILEYRAPEGKERLIGRKGTKEKKQQLAIEGAIIVDRKDNSPYRKFKFTNLTLITQRDKYVMEGSITYDVGLLDTDVKVTNDKNIIVIKKKVQRAGNDHYKADAEVSSSQYPDFGIAFAWEFKRSGNHIDHSIIFIHGPDPKSTSARVTFIHSSDRKTDKDFYLAMKNKLTYPLLGIEGKLNGQLTPKSFSYDVEAAYSNQHVSSKLDSKINTKHTGDYDIFFDFKALTSSIEIESKRVVSETRGKSSFSNTITLTPGGKYSLNGDVTAILDKEAPDLQFVAELILPKDPKSIKLDVGMKRSPNDAESHAIVNVGPSKYIDYSSQVSLVPGKPKGNFKLNILYFLSSSASYSSDSNKCLGSLNIDLEKFNRAIEGKAELTHSGGKAAGFAEVLYDAKNDPSKKIRLETNYEVNKEKGYLFNSKNNIFVNADKYIANVNFAKTGLYSDGQVSFDSELVLPSTRKINTRYVSEAHLGSDDKSLKIDAEISHAASKDAQPCKAHFKYNAKNLDFKLGTFDAQSEVELISPEQKDFKINVSGKRSKTEKTEALNGQVSVQGSLVAYPINGKFDVETNGSPSKGEFVDSSLHLAAAVGSEFQFNLAKKISKESYSKEVSAKFPQTNLIPISSFKFSTVNNFNIVAKAAGKPLKIKSANSIYYTDKTGEKFLKIDGDFTEVSQGATASLQYSSHEVSPRQLTGSFHYENADNYKGDASVTIKNGDQEGKIVVSGEIFKSTFGGSLKISGQDLISKGQGTFELDVLHKYNKEKKSSSSDVKANVNGKSLTLSHLVEWNVDKPLFDFSIKLPEGENRFFIKAEKKDVGHYSFDVKLNWIKNGGGYLVLDGERKVVSLEDFLIKFNVDSPKLNIKKYHIDIANKPVKGEANKITFSVRSEDKNVASGSSTYKFTTDATKQTLDGSGSIKLDTKSYPMSFQYSQQTLSSATDGEEGQLAKFSFDSKEAPLSINLVRKFSNKEISIKYKTCSKDVCDKLETISKVKGTEAFEFEHELVVNVDLALSVKNFINDVGLKAKTAISAKALTIDQNIELRLTPTEKVQYEIYFHKTASGVRLTLPQRVIAAEAEYSATAVKNEKVAMKYEGSIWLDKSKEPNQKTSISLTAGASRTPGSYSFASNGELRLSNPSLGKDLVIKGRSSVLEDAVKVLDSSVEIDIFNTKAQKITIDSSVTHSKLQSGNRLHGIIQLKSKGQNLDSELQWTSSYEKGTVRNVVSAYYYDSNNKKLEYFSKFEANKESYTGSVKFLDTFVFDGSGELKFAQKDYYVGFENKYKIFGRKYEENAYLYNDGKFKYVYKWLSADKALEVSGGIVLGKAADVDVSFIDGSKKPILQVSVQLDEANFLKPSQTFNVDMLKPLAALTQTETLTVLKEANKEGEIIVKELNKEILRRAEELKKAQPNLKAISQSYAAQLKALRTEIANDKVIKDISDHLKVSLDEVIKVFIAAVEKVVFTIEKISIQLEVLLEKLNESLQRLAPKIEEFYAKVSKSLMESFNTALHSYVKSVDKAIDFYKKIQPEVKELLKISNKFVEEIGKVFSKVFAQTEKEIRNFINQFVEQVKALPVYGMLKEKLEEFKKYEIPNQALSVFHEVSGAIRDTVPTQELKKLIEDIAKLIEKVLTHKSIDGGAELKVILNDLREAVQSLLVFLPSQTINTSVLSKPGSVVPLPSLGPLSKLYEYASFSASPLSYIKSLDLQVFNDLYQSLHPTTLNPKHLLPPHRGFAILVDSSHFFTFDKRHFTFKGSCSYVLAQDYKDKNFSLSATVESGKLKSITLSDTKDTVVMLTDGTLLVNGQPSDYPVRTGGLTSWRRYHTVNSRSDAGVFVSCTLDLNSCSFMVSGYYFDKIRGLLGTLNNEDFDDFTLPDNKISTSPSTFANAYKIGSCADAPEFTHHHSASSSECNSLFATDDTPLRFCKPFINIAPFREACEHSVSSATDKKAAACKIAGAYVASCVEHNIFAELPTSCAVCNALGVPLGVHKTSSIKVPKNSADVILLVEQLEGAEPVFQNLVTPLVSTLTNDLKQKGITDVNFALIGYTNAISRWPSHYSSKGKLSFDGKQNNIKFVKAPAPEAANTLWKKLKQVEHKVYLELGLTDSMEAVVEALEYPSRAEAVQIIVHVVANPERHTPSYYPISTLYPRALIGGLISRLYHYTNVLIIPTKGLSLNNSDSASVIGFNGKSVFTPDDVKQSPLIGNEELSKDLKYSPDLFVDFVKFSGGLVVSADNFIAAKPGAQKQFVQLISKFITQSSTETEYVRECVCILKYGLFPETKCFPTLMK